MQNRLFFPQTALDTWLVDGKVDLSGSELTVVAESRKFHITEALWVIREVTGEGDPNDLVGRVKSRLFLQELGAEIFEKSMIVGDRAYDVLPGWVGRLSSTFRDHIASDARRQARAERLSDFDDEPKTDEDLLVRTLFRNPKA